MKKTIAFLLGSFLSINAFAVEYPADAIEKKGDMFYIKETGAPLTGTLIRTFADGQFKSAFVDGILNGESQGYYTNGKLEHTITFKDNKKEGPFKKYDENGNLLASSNYKADKLEGDFIAYYPNGAVYFKETYQNDLLNGVKEIHYESGQLKSSATYKNNLLNGPAKEFYPDGKIQSEMAFKDNSREGVSKIYYPNGQVQYQMNYAQNKLTGEGVFYNEDGSLAQKRQYQNGLVIGGKLYQDGKETLFTQEQIDELNSKTIIHTQLNTTEENGLIVDSESKKPISGVYAIITPDKSAAEEYQYWNGKPHGLANRYDTQGRLMLQTIYQEGKKTAYREYDENGNIKKTCQLEDDKEICE